MILLFSNEFTLLCSCFLTGYIVLRTVWFVLFLLGAYLP
jgi:hypothetical protein